MAESLKPGGRTRQSLRYAARGELGLRAFLESGGASARSRTRSRTCTAWSNCRASPSSADGRRLRVRRRGRLEDRGPGARGEDHDRGLPGGTSFMEDYTYHLDPAGQKVLGAHMLEICPTLAAGKPSCEIHPLGIGGKADPVRLVFTAPPGPAVNVAMIDLGDRFRLLVNEVDAVTPEQPLPKLPVARALWAPRPDLKTAAAAWIYAGGPHHTVFSQAATAEHIEDFAEMLGIECLFIDSQTSLRSFKQQL
jgi:L-arabinose isomerase